MKKIFLLFGMVFSLAMTSCKETEKEVLVDNPAYSVLGQWYAELPMEGETPDMLSKEGELAPYDLVVVLLYLYEEECSSVVLFLYGEELIRYDYGDYLGGFVDYTIDKDGNISIMDDSRFEGEFRSAKYVEGTINANLTIPEGDLQLSFLRPTHSQIYFMGKWLEMIAGGFGYSDRDNEQNTDVTDNSASGPAQAPRR